MTKNNVNVTALHCIIHQEVLCAKIFKLAETTSIVITVINLICGGNKSHCHRSFVLMLEEFNAECEDLALHTEVRWLSAGKCLKQFFSM